MLLAKGLLALIHDIYFNNPKFVTEIIKFIFHLIPTNPAVATYLRKQPKELMWLKDFLESRLGFIFLFLIS